MASKKSGKLYIILRWIIVAMVIAVLLLLFINGGGLRAIKSTAHGFPALHDIVFGVASSSQNFQLPGQNDMFSNLGIDVDTGASTTTDAGSSAGDFYTQPPPSEIRSATPSEVNGATSPYAGKVTLDVSGAYETDPRQEYVTITANSGNASFVDVSGWTLQSAVSGVKVVIPLATSPYVLGIVNRVGDVTLDPGASAIITTGISPLGVSFRESECTGYLNQMQSFSPALSNACPAGSTVLPYNAQNLSRFGANCFDYVQSLPTCDFPRDIPQDLSAACRVLLTSAFSYNGCVNAHQSDSDFSLGNWRLYAAHTTELWGNTHDIIRLADRDGKTVDVVSY